MKRYPPNVAEYNRQTRSVGQIIHLRLNGKMNSDTFAAWYKHSTDWNRIPFDRVFHKCRPEMSIEECNIAFKIERAIWRLELLHRATEVDIAKTGEMADNTLQEWKTVSDNADHELRGRRYWRDKVLTAHKSRNMTGYPIIA